MASLGTLTLDLVAKTGGFTGPLDKAERASKKNAAAISKHQREITGAIGSSLKSLAGWAAGFVAFSSIKSFVKNSLDAAGAIQDVAATAGVTTDTLQEMRHVTSLFGMDAEQADAGLQKFNKSIGELKAGTGLLYTYLSKTDKALLSQVQSAKSADAALDIIFKSMKDVADSSERSALAVAAFGRSGQRMAIMADDYEKLRKEAQDLGLVIDSGLIESADEAGDKFDTMSQVIKTQLMVAVLDLAPAIQSVSASIIELSKSWSWLLGGQKRSNERIAELQATNVEMQGLNSLLREQRDIQTRLTMLKEKGSWYDPEELRQAQSNIESLLESVRELNGTGPGAPTTPDGSELSQQQKVEIYKKAFSELETITQKTYDVMKGEYQKDRDEFIDLTGDKLTAQAIYNKNIEALNKKLTGKDSGDSWGDFGDALKATSEYNKEVLKLNKELDAEIAAENDRQLKENIARDAVLRQFIYEAEEAEINNKADSIEKELELHELKFERLKELYTEGSEELVAIERIANAERDRIYKNDLANRKGINNEIVGNVGDAFSMMSSLAGQYAKEQSGIYKTLFLISKGFALADAIINLNMVISKATASAPPPYNIPAIAAAAIQGAIPIANIAAATFAGMAHDGIDSIPETGTWLLKKGERVTTAQTSKRLDDTLNTIQTNTGGASGGGYGLAKLKNDLHVHYEGPVFLNKSHIKSTTRLFMSEFNKELTRRGGVL